MSSSDVIGLQYSECDEVLKNLQSALEMVSKDLEYLASAASYASGCRDGASSAINSAKTGISSIKEDVENFKTDFNNYYTAVKAFDEEFYKDLREFAGVIGTLAAMGTTTEFGLLSTGKDGIYGVSKDLVKTFQLYNSCVITEKDGYYIISGLANKRSGISALKDIKGTRYKYGSAKFMEAGLYKYVPKGASVGEGLSKFGSNIVPNLKNGFKDFGSNTFKLKAGKGEIPGNVAKVLGYAAVAAGVAEVEYENYQKGADVGEYVGDGVVATAKGLGAMAAASAGAEIGFAIGTAIPIPVVGSVAGAALGFVGGYIAGAGFSAIVDNIEIGGEPICDVASEFIDKNVDKAVDTVKGWIDDIF